MTAGASSADAVRILIVDDHVGFRRRARSLLEEGGLAVVGEADDAATCLAAIGALRPTLVLLDIRLPGDDGFTVAQRIALEPDPPGVVLVSSRALAEFGVRPIPSSVLGFIGKADLSAGAILALLGP